ncbi:hypothetical protein PoB_007134200 [Plakobranchus ocellatus]|uniref:Uncharacterized protein n=1 Tax=Plakobranchus ocellatus TaxID=259542 RepID=A0AAV4DKM4_9GAST|nr:hypothetical protein PoB_007134200 [Plakobranchus ocellatus]
MPSVFHNDVLFSIAGFLCRKLMLKLKCLACLDAIGKRASACPDLDVNPHAALTLRKDRGGLLTSNDIYRIVCEVDKVLRRLITTSNMTTLSSKAVVAVQLVLICENIRHSLFQVLPDHVVDTHNPLTDDHGTQIIKLVCHMFIDIYNVHCHAT